MNREIVSSIIDKCASITEDMESIIDDRVSLYTISLTVNSLADVIAHYLGQHKESLTEEEKAYARMIALIEMLKTPDK